MSKRAALSSAVLVVAALALGLGYYFGRDEPPAPAAPAPATAEPTPPPKTVPQLLDEVQTQRAEPSAPDRVKERRVSMPADTVVAVIGDEQIPLRIQVVPRGTRSTVELVAIEQIGDDGRSSGFFAPLAAAARAGNDEAARVLHDALAACRGYPTTRAGFDARLEQMRKGYAQAGGIAGPGEQPQDWNSIAADLESHYHRCEGVTDAMYQTSLDLLRESVERGDPPAPNRLLYAEAVRKTDPPAARAQYEILWQNGYLLALGGLTADSLPHQIAWVAVSIAELHAPPETMTALEASASPSAFHDASKEAARILKNPNCCKL
jgi:hypothetical protein